MKSQYDILVVEDEEVVTESTRKILLPEGYTLDQTTNAEEALDKLKDNTYNLIISDLMLPDKSGFDLAEQVTIHHPRIPIIMITGYATHENAIRSFKAGVFDFIPKPFIIEELLGVVYRGLNFSNSMKQSAPEKILSDFLDEFNDSRLPPKSVYFLGNHSWAVVNAEGYAVFGVGLAFPNNMGKLQKLEFVELNTEILQGNCCLQIKSEEELFHSVWAPLSGKIVEINQNLLSNSELINSDPVNEGWLLKVIPTNLELELKNLSEHVL